MAGSRNSNRALNGDRDGVEDGTSEWEGATGAGAAVVARMVGTGVASTGAAVTGWEVGIIDVVGNDDSKEVGDDDGEKVGGRVGNTVLLGVVVTALGVVDGMAESVPFVSVLLLVIVVATSVGARLRNGVGAGVGGPATSGVTGSPPPRVPIATPAPTPQKIMRAQQKTYTRYR